MILASEMIYIFFAVFEIAVLEPNRIVRKGTHDILLAIPCFNQ